MTEQNADDVAVRHAVACTLGLLLNHAFESANPLRPGPNTRQMADAFLLKLWAIGFEVTALNDGRVCDS
jgi:hypothetical protein